MRVAILANMAHNAFMGMGTGLARGMRELGHDCRPFHVADHQLGLPWVREELRDFGADLVCITAHMYLATLRWLVQAATEQRDGVVVCSLSYDDPYDLDSSLKVARFADCVLTAERGCIPAYEAQGFKGKVAVMPAWYDEHLGQEAPDQGVADEFDRADVGFVGHAILTPRAEFFRRLTTEMNHRGMRLKMADGSQKLGTWAWVVGRELCTFLRGTALCLEYPRIEFTAGNPHKTPCTYVSPRVHMHAAFRNWQCFVQPEGGNEDRIAELHRLYPAIPVVRPVPDDVLDLLKATPAEERQRQVEDNFARFQACGTGLVAAKSVLASVRGFGYALPD